MVQQLSNEYSRFILHLGYALFPLHVATVYRPGCFTMIQFSGWCMLQLLIEPVVYHDAALVAGSA